MSGDRGLAQTLGETNHSGGVHSLPRLPGILHKVPHFLSLESFKLDQETEEGGPLRGLLRTDCNDIERGS